MTKQEQIAEMAVLGCVRNPQAHTAEECAKCDFKHGMCNAYRHAEALYNAGYRKLPEDSVVLSREEYEKLKMLEECHITCEDMLEFVEKARKETAEEILNAVVGAIDNGTFFRKNFIFMMNKVYGVEVQNDNNDKTIEQANKKIVRQFYNKIQKMLDETRQVIEEPCNGRQNAGYCVADVDNGLKELAKQFGAEIKEY